MRAACEITVRLNARQKKQAQQIAEMACVDVEKAVQIIVNRNLPALHALFITGLPAGGGVESESESERGSDDA